MTIMEYWKTRTTDDEVEAFTLYLKDRGEFVRWMSDEGIEWWSDEGFAELMLWISEWEL